MREAFVQRGNDAAGRPYKDHFKVVSSNINPHYPKAGMFIFINFTVFKFHFNSNIINLWCNFAIGIC